MLFYPHLSSGEGTAELTAGVVDADFHHGRLFGDELAVPRLADCSVHETDVGHFRLTLKGPLLLESTHFDLVVLPSLHSPRASTSLAQAAHWFRQQAGNYPSILPSADGQPALEPL
uniref:Uncharacterized protein n=2 Tax=Calcidiscus leptoporus TaxID=127549 RepID=A0A7S0INY0_9EUKA|mmetsp:Transcript_14756/g.33724  ORF Transcript_14756/g.33724 Transcript_14756/m.33724 type:complete len:116 (+) Transcript_14756:443-790(+)